jgi:hypothetical protein
VVLILYLCSILLIYESRASSVGIALGYGLENRGSRVRFPAGAGNFLFITASRTALGPTQPPIKWVPGALSLGVKRPWREADHSPPSCVQVKECVEIYLHSPNTPSFYLTFTFPHFLEKSRIWISLARVLWDLRGS